MTLIESDIASKLSADAQVPARRADGEPFLVTSLSQSLAQLWYNRPFRLVGLLLCPEPQRTFNQFRIASVRFAVASLALFVLASFSASYPGMKSNPAPSAPPMSEDTQTLQSSKPQIEPGLTARDKIDQYVKNASREFNVKEELILAVITVESNFNHRARSEHGALGLMQLMPQTAKALSIKNPLDPEQNIRGGVQYLAELLDRFDGDLVRTLAAYNAGPTAVSRHGGVPPINETQSFVRKVLEALKQQIALAEKTDADRS